MHASDLRIDVVVDLSADAVAEFYRQFPEDDFDVSAEAALDAVRRHSMFNIIQPRSGLEVDVIIPAPSAFNRERFARARRVRAGEDWDAAFSSPEDAIRRRWISIPRAARTNTSGTSRAC